jgi:hypothetical protein
MKQLLPPGRAILGFLPIFLLLSPVSFAADHNDPNAINSIFSDIDANAADLYDLYGFPSDDVVGGEKVVVALTFASVPATGAFDPDLLYRILIAPNPRIAPPLKDDASLEGILKYFAAIKDKYLRLKPSEVRVTVGKNNQAKVELLRFPGGNFSASVAIIGGRDDAFFSDLPGFFRSINYAPQFYNIPLFLSHRHGHHRHLALRASTGRSGGHQIPLPFSRHEPGCQRPEIQYRDLERSSFMGRGADRTEDTA